MAKNTPKLQELLKKMVKIINLPYYLSHFMKKNPLFGVDLFPWTFDMESPFTSRILFGIGATIRIGQDILCLSYAGFFQRNIKMFFSDFCFKAKFVEKHFFLCGDFIPFMSKTV